MNFAGKPGVLAAHTRHRQVWFFHLFEPSFASFCRVLGLTLGRFWWIQPPAPRGQNPGAWAPEAGSNLRDLGLADEGSSRHAWRGWVRSPMALLLWGIQNELLHRPAPVSDALCINRSWAWVWVSLAPPSLSPPTVLTLAARVSAQRRAGWPRDV